MSQYPTWVHKRASVSCVLCDDVLEGFAMCQGNTCSPASSSSPMKSSCAAQERSSMPPGLLGMGFQMLGVSFY